MPPAEVPFAAGSPSQHDSSELQPLFGWQSSLHFSQTHNSVSSLEELELLEELEDDELDDDELLDDELELLLEEDELDDDELLDDELELLLEDDELLEEDELLKDGGETLELLDDELLPEEEPEPGSSAALKR